MEVQDHPDQDVNDNPTVAVRGKAYPIRMLHMVDGSLIIGYVINLFPDTIILFRPHYLNAVENPQTGEVDEYEFEPYLDQMIHFHPEDMVGIPFMNSAVISVSRPAQHIIQNYSGVMTIKDQVHFRPGEDEPLYSRYPSSKTRH